MPASFYFYDLETSGINKCEDRIMQFAGQRTDMNLKPIGEPHNVLVKITPDVLPNPDAVMLTGVTPQMTLADGLTEAEFLKYFYDEIVQPDTIFLGYNTVRFDDEFMRNIFWRNMYDSYEWQWKDGCSRWDLLDVVRMTRALRPDGIEWPFTPEGKPTNRLELITELNGLTHDQAHDALSDVHATIDVARLIMEHQPKLFNFLLNVRNKKKVRELVTSRDIFMYSSGKYPGQFQHTSAVTLLAEQSSPGKQGKFLIYDLRHDPTPFLTMTTEQLAEAWEFSKDENKLRLPIKTLKDNNCPAISPGFPKDKATLERLGLDEKTITRNYAILKSHKTEFTDKIHRVVAIRDKAQDEHFAEKRGSNPDCDGQLYDGGFLSDADRTLTRAIRAAKPSEIMDYAAKVRDKRLQAMLPRYKARNYPKSLSDEERQAWDEFCQTKLSKGGEQSRLGAYFAKLQELSAKPDLTENQRYVLEELKLYGESLIQ